MVNIAVTGNLGTGKSTVSKMLAVSLGAESVDTDQLCRLQLQPGAQGYAAFRRIFGNEYIQADGIIDRDLLKKAVFRDEGVKAALENILHPLVKQQVAARIGVCQAAARNLVVEVPLLFETGWQDVFDLAVVVYVPVGVCVKRVKARDIMADAEIEKILASQMPLTRKREYADFVIDNSGTFVSTVQQVSWLARELMNLGMAGRKTQFSKLKSLTAEI